MNAEGVVPCAWSNATDPVPALVRGVSKRVARSANVANALVPADCCGALDELSVLATGELRGPVDRPRPLSGFKDI